MNDNFDNEWQQILTKLKELEQQRDNFSLEILLLKNKLKNIQDNTQKATNQSVEEEKIIPEIQPKKPEIQKPITTFSTHTKSKTNFFPKDWETFIGKRIFSIVGVLITFIGIIIGLKYAIDKGYLVPQVRVILGYSLGISLLIISEKLKKKYQTYSAVVLSGALAIIYFTTYIAFSQYQLINQIVAFVIMLLCTLFAVLASLRYNQMIIALIGMLGSYAIPFLVSNDSGSIPILLSYVTLINIGILVISIYKNWNILRYLAFIVSWIIMIVSSFELIHKQQFALYLAFTSVQFLLFYGIFLIYKLRHKENFHWIEIVMICANAFIFYALGYINFYWNPINYKPFLGIFTLCNAIIHFCVTYILYKTKNIDSKTIYIASGLVITFVTLVFPAQFNGNWVTLFWTTEALALAYIAYKKQLNAFSIISLIMIGIAFISWIEDYSSKSYETIYAFANAEFFTGIYLTIISFIAFYWVSKKQFSATIMYLFLIFGLVILFISGYNEIEFAYNQYQFKTQILITENNHTYNLINYNTDNYKYITQLLYAMCFVMIAYHFAKSKITSSKFHYITLIINRIIIGLSLTFGLLCLSNLRENYLFSDEETHFIISQFALWFRYIFLAIFLFFIFKTYQIAKKILTEKSLQKVQYIVLPIVVIWLISSEFLHWFDVFGFTTAYKLISIIWALYAIIIIFLGLKKNQKQLRWLGMIFLGLIILKLFLYDLATQTTIFKTILFVSIGLIILLISYFYNRYNTEISDDEK